MNAHTRSCQNQTPTVHSVPARARMSGFTLVEMAAAVLIIGVVAAISLGAFSGAFGSREVRTADGIGQTINGALLTYARKSHHLPCPDLNGDGREGDAGGTCAATADMGYVPYESIGLEQPATAARAIYGVYRNAAAGADLVVTTGKADFQRALAAAAAVTPVASTRVYITGDAAATGPVDCAANRVLHPAFAVVVPVTDRDGDGKTLDGVDAGLPTSGHCLASPNSPPSATFDEHVVFTGFTTLLGLISTDSP
ncbi:MAG: type II secretion system protein [Rhodanobacteraceae bacterium]